MDTEEIRDSKDVIKRLCKLQEKVASHVGWEYAADCFCGHGGFWTVHPTYDGTFDQGYRNDGVALEFIEQAVAEKIEREQASRRRP